MIVTYKVLIIIYCYTCLQCYTYSYIYIEFFFNKIYARKCVTMLTNVTSYENQHFISYISVTDVTISNKKPLNFLEQRLSG